MKIAIYWIIDYISLYYISFILFFFSFISDCIQISQILNVRQKQSNGECLMGMFMVLLCYIGRDDSYNSQGVVYTYRRGAFALLVSTELGNARALVRGTSNR